MPEEAKIYQLIVQQRPTANPELDELLKTLQADYSLEAYTARHRLIGPGMALFGKGEHDQVGEIAALLRQYGFRCWQIVPQTPQFAPTRLRGLELHDDYILFDGHEGPVRFERGIVVVGIIADLSGHLRERVVRRHMVEKRYKGADSVVAISLDDKCKTIFKGQPILDLYLVDQALQPLGAVRVLAGRFDASGLGDRMTVSGVRNMEALIKLVDEYAGRFVLHADFGLSRLPGCEMQTLEGKLVDPLTMLDRLTQYGWLMCDLLQDQPQKAPELIDPVLAAAAIATGRPGLAAAAMAGETGAIPGLDALSRELYDQPTDQTDSSAAVDASDDWLPSPPARRKGHRFSTGQVLSGFSVAVLAGLYAALKNGDFWVVLSLKEVFTWGLQIGALPALLSVGLFFGGFHFIRLKRRIENTPTSRIRSIAMGLVEVHGRAYRKYALVSPMSQSACIYYRLRKYRKESSGKWQLTSDTNSGHVPFLVDDGTGRILIDPMGATVRAKTSQTGTSGEMTMAFSGVSIGDDEKWVEDIIYEGTSLYVIGFARPLREERPGLRERAMEKLRQLKLDPQAMHRYDTDGDGQIDEAEWDVARSDAEQQALQEHLSAHNERKRQEEHVVIAKPSQRSLPFVIAEAVSEAHLTRKYGLFSVPLLLAAAAAMGLGIYKFLEFIGG
jgi:hypothetical protein